MRKFIFLMLMITLGFSSNVKGQISITTTGNYFQNFDGLGTVSGTWADNSTIANWYAKRTGTGTSITVSTGTTTGGDLYNFGSSAAADRALGSIGSGNAAAGSFAYGVQFQNNSGAPLTDLNVAYKGEQWRNSAAAAQTVSFYYKVSSSPIIDLQPNVNATWTAVTTLDFTSPITGGTAGALNGNAVGNFTVINNTAIPALNIPDGSYIMIKWDDKDHTGTDHGLAIDSVTVSWTAATNAITTGTITGSPFCVTPTIGSNVSVPFTIFGTYNTGNIFQAYLSDAAGSFASETLIGSDTAVVAGTINAKIPANTPSGAGYRIRVKSTDPALTASDNGANLQVVLGIQEVTGVSAIGGFTQANVHWTNPTICFDEVMVVAKPTASITALPGGNGSVYTANSLSFTDPLNTAFDGTGVVVYKSAVPGPAIITGLVNGTTYYIKLFTRRDTVWSPGVEVTATPQNIPNLVISEIMYNTGGGSTDTLEFIELLNNDVLAVNVCGYTISQGVSDTLEAVTMNPGDRIIIAKDSVAFTNFYGFPSYQWKSGTLNNTGEPIVLKNNTGSIVDTLDYLAVYPWPVNALLHSITLCDPSLDNNIGANWSLATEYVDTLISGDSIFANPLAGCTIIIPPADTTHPVVLNAWATGLSTVKVSFSEAMDQTTAENVSNYTFISAVAGTAVLSATLDTVTLSLSTPLVSGVPDTITIDNVTDSTGNPMPIAQSFPIVYGSVVTPIDTIVYWTFPSSTGNQIAEGGITANLAKTIRREGPYAGSYTFSSGVTTYAISSTAWGSGAGTKYYMIDFSTALYDSIKFSSSMRASNTGPRDFTCEYSLDGSTWVALNGTNRSLTSSSFAAGKITNKNLPSICYNQPDVYIRWIMTSDTCAADTFGISPTGTARIDNIFVTGRYNPILSVQQLNVQQIDMYPNPSNGLFTVNIPANSGTDIKIYSIIGDLVYSTRSSEVRSVIDLTSAGKGIYIVRFTDVKSGMVTTKKLSVQ
jgi:hypothetical protein